MLCDKFQFHYGSVKRPITAPKKQAGLDFNSTMVRLKVKGAVVINEQAAYFNSTMVRLKAYQFSNNFEGLSEFQFHYGSVKSRISLGG